METQYPHLEALEDNNLTLKDIPEQIRRKIYQWNHKYKTFESNPTERVKENLMRDSIAMADSIQDFAEKDIDDGSQPEAPVQNQPEAPQIEGVVNPQSQSDLQNAISGHLSKEGRIYYIDLEKALGQKNIPDRVEVAGVVLHRSLAFYYPA